MAHLTLPGDPPIDILLRRSGRARRLSLRISSLDGRVTLTLPARLAEHEARVFAAQKEAWLRRHLSDRPEPIRPAIGSALPVEGQIVQICPGTGRSARLEGATLLVPGDAARVPARLRAFLVARAHARLDAAAGRYGQALGRRHSRITLRDPRSRWGSCSATGGLMFSWRLIMAPQDVLDYVAAHEVAHLAEMNHSPAFWAVVARLCPGFETPRTWLRREGARLHRYDFSGR